MGGSVIVVIIHVGAFPYTFLFSLDLSATLRDKQSGSFYSFSAYEETKSQRGKGTDPILFGPRRNTYVLNVCKCMPLGETYLQTKELGYFNFFHPLTTA